jgi:hypothetical protein
MGVQEGYAPKRSTPEHEEAPVSEPVKKKEKKEPTPQPDLVSAISPENIEGLMERQSELMNNLKTIQPMVDQARQIMNSMPKEFMQKALEGFMKK